MLVAYGAISLSSPNPLNMKEVTWRTKRAPSFYTSRTIGAAPIVREVSSLGALSQSAFTDQLIQTSELNLP